MKTVNQLLDALSEIKDKTPEMKEAKERLIKLKMSHPKGGLLYHENCLIYEEMLKI